MIPRLTDFGYTLVEASLVMSLCAGFGVVGKLSFGWLSDRLSVRKVMAIVIFMQFTGQYLMFSSLDYLTFAIGASMFGYGVGGVVPMHGAVVGKTFGRDRFGAVLGLMRPAMFPIQILGVPFAGWIFDVTGSYNVAFQVFLGLYFLAALAVSFYRQPAKSVT
jgi:MFS family permease